LSAINVDSENTHYASESGVLYNKNKTEILTFPRAKSGTYIIPNTVASIGEYVFLDCSSLTSVVIPESVASIGEYAFLRCTNLTTVVIPESVTSIGRGTFSQCNALTSVVIPNTVKSIGESAFYYCNRLTSLVIPESVTTIGSNAFQNCTGLTDVTVKWPTPLSVGGTIFANVTLGSKDLHVPAGTQSLYEAAPVWGNFGTVVEDTGTDWLTVLPASLSLTSAGSLQNITVSSGAGWAAESSATWLTVSPASGTGNGLIGLTADAYTGSSPRTATVTVTGSDITRTVNVTQTAPPATLTVLPASLEFAAAGGLTNIAVTSNASWTAGSPAAWLTVSPPSGTNDGSVSITAAANSTGSTRATTVTLTAGSVTRTVSVAQASASSPAPSLTVVPASLDFAAESATLNIIVTSNTGWTATGSEAWLTVLPASGTDNGTVAVTVAANTGSARAATVTLTDGGITRTVAVAQAATSAPPAVLTATPASLDFAAAGQAQNITVASNANWTVISSAAWLSVSPASGTNGGTAVATAEANTGSARTATVTLTGGGIMRSVNITQAGVSLPATALTVTPASLDFSAAAGSQSIAVASNTGWTAAGSATWLTVTPASGANSGTVNVTVAAHTGSSARTAAVTLTGGGITRTVNVTQAAASATPELTVSPASLELAATGGAGYIAVASNTAWTAVSSAPWLTVSPASASNSGTVTVLATAHTDDAPRTATVTLTGDDITRTVSVTQAAGQQVVVDPVPPVTPGNGANISVSLNVPSSEPFSVWFILTLPDGFRLDVNATSLVPELAAGYLLTVTPASTGGWMFLIQPVTSTRAADETVYRELLQITYTVDPAVTKGDYEVKLNDVSLALNDGTTVYQDEITVPVTVLSSVGNAVVNAGDVRYAGGILTVNTPVAERVTVYSISGSVMYQAQKASGEATFDLHSLPKGVFVARGSSGWTKKIVISG
jgi:hypothetical protein